MPLIHVVVSTCRRERYVLNLLSTEPSDFVVRPSTRQELERYHCSPALWLFRTTLRGLEIGVLDQRL